MRARARCATVLCSVGLALACDDASSEGTADPQPIPGCEAFTLEPCDILTDGCQRGLFALMACARGEPEPGEPPSVRLLSPEDAAAVALSDGDPMSAMSSTDGLAGMPSAGDPARLRAQLRGLELLGLIDPGLVTDAMDVVDVQFSAVIAFYLMTTQEIVIVDRGAPRADLDADGVLAHELVHALQDRRHDLAAIGGDVAVTSDGSLAIASLIEGEASLYQNLFMFTASGAALEDVDLARFYTSVSAYGTRQTLQAGSPLLTAPSIFPYSHGARYAFQLWARGGAAGLDAAYADPPRTTLEVLGGEGSVSEWPAAPEPLEGYELLGDDVAGAWVTAATQAGLSRASDPVELAQLARRWRGDRLWVYASGGEPAAVAAAWAIDWVDAETASAFAAALAGYAPDGAALAIDTSGRSTRLSVAESTDELDAWRERLAQAAPPAP